MMSKLRVFDFDDTLVKTESVVYVHTADNQIINLLPGEFATYVAKPGDRFDFSDFDLVKQPRAKRHDVVFKKCLAKGDSDVVILTARANGARDALRAYLSQKYKTTSAVQIITLGSSDPYDKALWIRDAISKNGYNDLYFCDDSWENCRAVGDVCNKLNLRKMKIQKL